MDGVRISESRRCQIRKTQVVIAVGEFIFAVDVWPIKVVVVANVCVKGIRSCPHLKGHIAQFFNSFEYAPEIFQFSHKSGIKGGYG